jgi:phage protein D
MLPTGTGIGLKLMLGSTDLRDAPGELLTSLRSVEVTSQASDKGDGFQMTLTLRKDPSGEYGLLDQHLLDPPTRAVIAVVLNAMPEVLIDGVVTHTELAPSTEPGLSTLTVTGQDISVLLDMDEKQRTSEGQRDSNIVESILGSPEYARFGIKPAVAAAGEQPDADERTPAQVNSTDLAYIRQLAKKHAFSFYVEPVGIGVSRAYFGPKDLSPATAPAFSIGLGTASNTSSLTFTADAMAAAAATGVVMDPVTKKSVPIVREQAAEPLARETLPMRRTRLLNNAANLGTADAQAAATQLESEQTDPVAANGEVETVRYGAVLRPRRKVAVRGAGRTFDGDYYLSQVTHKIDLVAGRYTQSFQLQRKGLGARQEVLSQ